MLFEVYYVYPFLFYFTILSTRLRMSFKLATITIIISKCYNENTVKFVVIFYLVYMLYVWFVGLWLYSCRWPLLIDSGKQAATFLRYRDTNYVNCCNPRQMDPQALRMALLGAIK